MSESKNFSAPMRQDPHEDQIPFTQISNELIRNKELKLETTMLLIRLLSNAPGWVIYTTQLIQEYDGRHGIDKIRSMINELIEAGYIFRHKYHDEKGFFKMEYHVSMKPKFKNKQPQPDLPYLVKPGLVNTPPKNTNTKEKQQNKLLLKKPPVGASEKEEDVCSVNTEGIPSRCKKTMHNGNVIEITMKELYARIVREGKSKEWNEHQIQESWKILCEYQDPITDWYLFFAAVAANIKNKKENNKCQKKQQNNNKKQEKNTKDSYGRDKNSSTESDTSEPPFLGWKDLAKELGVS